MLKIRYLHKTRREIPGIYARNPSIILQNMNFSRYYRYRAQLIYSFDRNIIITEYLTNYMCFIVLSVEIFSILFTFGVVKSVVALLFVNTTVFIGLLAAGLLKMDLRGKEI